MNFRSFYPELKARNTRIKKILLLQCLIPCNMSNYVSFKP